MKQDPQTYSPKLRDNKFVIWNPGSWSSVLELQEANTRRKLEVYLESILDLPVMSVKQRGHLKEELSIPQDPEGAFLTQGGEGKGVLEVKDVIWALQ